jgi:hypothetical protein
MPETKTPERHMAQIPFSENDLVTFMALVSLGNVVLNALVARAMMGVAGLPKSFPTCCAEHSVAFKNAFDACQRVSPEEYRAMLDRIIRLSRAAFPNLPIVHLEDLADQVRKGTS